VVFGIILVCKGQNSGRVEVGWLQSELILNHSHNCVGLLLPIQWVVGRAVVECGLDRRAHSVGDVIHFFSVISVGVC